MPEPVIHVRFRFRIIDETRLRHMHNRYRNADSVRTDPTSETPPEMAEELVTGLTLGYCPELNARALGWEDFGLERIQEAG